jgi:hypothetical protein
MEPMQALLGGIYFVGGLYFVREALTWEWYIPTWPAWSAAGLFICGGITLWLI